MFLAKVSYAFPKLIFNTALNIFFGASGPAGATGPAGAAGKKIGKELPMIHRKTYKRKIHHIHHFSVDRKDIFRFWKDLSYSLWKSVFRLTHISLMFSHISAVHAD